GAEVGLLALPLPRRLLHGRHRGPGGGQVYPSLALELIAGEVAYRVAPVGPACLSVSARRKHLKDPPSKLHHRDVVRSSSEAEDEDLHLLLQLVQPVRQRGGCRLVDYPHYLQPGYLPRVLGGLPLIVVEVGRDCDHRLLYREAEEVLRVLLDLL